jgi:hypothetical protein
MDGDEWSVLIRSSFSSAERAPFPTEYMREPGRVTEMVRTL